MAEVLSKPESPLTEPLRLTLYTGRLQIHIDNHTETKSSEKYYG